MMRVLLLLASLVGVVMGQAVNESPLHSFKGPFDPQQPIPYWTSSADAVVTTQFIELTQDRGFTKGALWNSRDTLMTSWEVVMQFRVTGWPDMGGDGMAIWYVESPNNFGSVFGNADYWEGLGIFFETPTGKDGGEPRVYAVVNDGTQSYEQVAHDDAGLVGSCNVNYRNRQQPSFIKVRYVNARLTVSLDLDANGDWIQCFDADNIDLGIDHYFGVTAQAGEVADTHAVHYFVATDMSPSNVDYEAVRAAYEASKTRSLHQAGHDMEYDDAHFQHSLLTSFHQMQDTLNLMELSQVQIGHMIAILPAAAQAGAGAGGVAQSGAEDPATRAQKAAWDAKVAKGYSQFASFAATQTALAQSLTSLKAQIDSLQGQCGGGVGGGAAANPAVASQSMAHNMQTAGLQRRQQDQLAAMAGELQQLLQSIENEVSQLKEEKLASIRSGTGTGGTGTNAQNQAAQQQRQQQQPTPTQIRDQFETMKQHNHNLFHDIDVDVKKMQADLSTIKQSVERVNAARQAAVREQQRHNTGDIYRLNADGQLNEAEASASFTATLFKGGYGVVSFITLVYLIVKVCFGPGKHAGPQYYNHTGGSHRTHQW